MHAYGPRQSINCMVFPSIKIPYTVLCACMDAHRPWKWINWSFLAWTSIKQFTAYENSPRNCMYYIVFPREEIHYIALYTCTQTSFVHKLPFSSKDMHYTTFYTCIRTSFICAQTGVTKQGNTLHSLACTHAYGARSCTKWHFLAWTCMKHSLLHVHGLRSCTNMRFQHGHTLHSLLWHAYRSREAGNGVS